MTANGLTHRTAAHRGTRGRSSSGRTRSPLRWLAALTLLATGATHIPVTPEHLEEAPYIGALFLALAIVSFALAILVVGTDHPLVWVTSGIVCALAVGAYLLSRAVALPQIGDDVGNWLEPLGVAAIAVEAATVVLALLRLRRRTH